jgi:hypothetical protein
LPALLTSAVTGEGLDKLAQAIRETLAGVTEQQQKAASEEDDGLGDVFRKLARDQSE